DWKSAHPLLRFVSFDNVQVAKALAIKTPAWAIAVADSPQTPLILAGELARQRIVWLGFDTLESTWPLRISFPIFIANAVDWLNPASIQTSQLLVKAGEPLRQALNEPVPSAEVTFPDGRKRALAVDTNAQELVFGDTARQGVYHRRTVGANGECGTRNAERRTPNAGGHREPPWICDTRRLSNYRFPSP